MRFCVLASGSKGNSTYLEINNKKYLIDLGVNYNYLVEKLEEIKVKPDEISGIFITHLHEDHIIGLPRFLKLWNPTIYLSKSMHEHLNIPIKNYEYLESSLELDNLIVEALNLSHDTECNGYIFTSEGKDLVYITDTGYINIRYHEKLTNKNAYIFESNHDIDMLMKSRRPHHIKMRILGNVGHISNKDCAYYLSKFVGDRTGFIVLAHLSEENNFPERALSSIQEVITGDTNIVVATQKDRTGVMEI